MKRIAILLSSLLLLLTGCGGNISDSSYEQITQEAAKEMMDTQEVIVLDVRETAATFPALSCCRWVPLMKILPLR